MNECNSLKIDETNLSDPTKIRLDKITEIENYFHQEINQRKLCSKKINKYVAAFDYIDKVLIILGTTSSGVSIISFTSVVGVPLRSTSFTLMFSQTTGIIKKLLIVTKKQNEKAW